MAAKSKASADEEPTKELVEVTLSKEHTHKRQRLTAGDKIQVTPKQKEWLEGQGKVGAPKEEVSNV